MSKPTVLIVDELPENLLILEKILEEDYNVLKYTSGTEVLAYLQTTPNLPKAILLDIVMRGMDGYQVLDHLKSNYYTKDIPVICVTATDTERTALDHGAADYMTKPVNPYIVKLRIKNQISLKLHTENLENLVEEKVKEVIDTRNNMLTVMADMIEYRNVETGSHVKRTTAYVKILATELVKDNIYKDQIEAVGLKTLPRAIPTHDIGKIGIPDKILLKPGKLTEEEFEIIKTHTTIGRNIINRLIKVEDFSFLYLCSDIAYYHHEWYDGSGYPEGISGKDIPLGARIMAIADVYDALVTKRVYKPAFDHKTATKMISERSGTHFDPLIVAAFLKAHKEFQTIARKNLKLK